MKHTDIRRVVIEKLESAIGSDVVFFDGRPAVMEEDDFPAIAVYLTDAEYTGKELDADTWEATLHIEVFLPAQVQDSQLDEWMEKQIYPAIAEMDGLSHLLTVMVPQGYDYERDDSLGLWSSADMKYSITYDM
ncbi:MULTISPECIES: phage minor tail U family protein [Klebsiella]|uniref:phage minor tail U family protein n=1 Tax=Klebsiella TaxID=570 RepID=UPI00058AFB2C|nr:MULTISPECIES: phage minor tail U family protein [Klebsiella]HCB1752214.1 phage tail protein [Klebsiella oxytoca]EKP1128690.1 phage tail protein [Klebsiella michiganensis]MCX3082835.1 phage minor tail U family protein [Klebsiella michiganensis]MDQ4328340.1 phage minor tail U family protein [Klebsiella michiganensis]HCB1759076.1 phage tail protein [Klebsiella oxytoca]